jgi:hypothetical protein
MMAMMFGDDLENRRLAMQHTCPYQLSKFTEYGYWRFLSNRKGDGSNRVKASRRLHSNMPKINVGDRVAVVTPLYSFASYEMRIESLGHVTKRTVRDCEVNIVTEFEFDEFDHCVIKYHNPPKQVRILTMWLAVFNGTTGPDDYVAHDFGTWTKPPPVTRKRKRKTSVADGDDGVGEDENPGKEKKAKKD